MTSMIEIKLNGKNTQIEGSQTVSALLNSLNIKAQQVAVAINGEVVTRSTWSEVEVTSGDSVEVVRAVGGG